jgi:tetratricopeptide (TPR) repeat protein
LIVRFQDRKEPQIVEQVAKAMVNKGISLWVLNRSEEEIAVYDDLIVRFQDRKEPQIVEQVAKAMVNKGISLWVLNRSEEAITVYDDLIVRFQDRKEPQIVEQVAKAMFNKGISLGVLNRSEEAIAVYDDLIVRFQDRKEPQIVEKVAKAMVNKGFRLGELNRTEEAYKVFQEWISLLGSIEGPEVKDLAITLRMFFKIFPVEICKELLTQLETLLKGDARDSLRLFWYVLNVLETQEPSSDKKPAHGPGIRLRKGLALVPPELRETVKDAVDSVLKARRQISKEKTQFSPGRGGGKFFSKPIH